MRLIRIGLRLAWVSPLKGAFDLRKIFLGLKKQDRQSRRLSHFRLKRLATYQVVNPYDLLQVSQKTSMVLIAYLEVAICFSEQ